MKGLDMAKPKKAVAKAKEFAFEKGDFVVYPTHGVGKAEKRSEHCLGIDALREREAGELADPASRRSKSGNDIPVRCLGAQPLWTVHA